MLEEGFSAEFSDVVVVLGATICVSPVDVLPMNIAPLGYPASTEWEPTANPDVVKVATPLAFRAVGEPNAEPSIESVTFPVGTSPVELVTITVNCTA